MMFPSSNLLNSNERCIFVVQSVERQQDSAEAVGSANLPEKEIDSPTASTDQKIVALSEMARRIERYSESQNPVPRYSGEPPIILTDVHVERVGHSLAQFSSS